MSEIKIYNTYITPERNALVDDLSLYLASLAPTYTNNAFQHLQLGLDLTIVIPAGQEYVGEAVGNYVDLLQDGKHYYFFILSSKWSSKEGTKLQLSIDSINTFKNDITLTEKTKIIREHKNRFKKITYNNTKVEQDHVFQEGQGEYTFVIFNDPNLIGKSTYGFEWTGNVWFEDPINQVEIRKVTFNPENGDITVTWFEDIFDSESAEINEVRINYTANNFVRAIDKLSENISAVKFHNPSNDYKILENNTNLNWYLIYKNQNEPDPDLDINPVDCFICADEPITISTSEDTVVDRDALEYGKYYLIYASDNGNTLITFRDSYGNTAGAGVDSAGNNRYGMVITKTQNGFSYFTFAADGQTIYSSKYNFDNAVETTSLKLETAQAYINARAVAALPSNPGSKPGVNLSTITTIGQYTINSIKSLVRTDPKLIKVIKLPYCPVQDITDTTVVALEQGFLRLVDENIKFDNTFDSTFNPLDALFVDDIDSSVDIPKDEYYESKLYHSDFYQPKFVYDSFGFNFNLEDVSVTNDTYDIISNCVLNFTPTSTINSKFLFTFNSYVTDYASEDYSNILLVARNNEITLYNSAYVNYIKNGYNYEVKAKNSQTVVNWFTTGVNVTGSIVSFAFSGATGGISAAAGVGLAVSSISSIASNINSTVQSDNTLASKLEQAKSQSVAVSGADDVDLMSKYCDNKAKFCIYKVSDVLRYQLWDLFHNFGYTSNRNGVPDTTSRRWFNYVQCEADIETAQVYNVYVKDIKARFASGVTVYHNHMISGNRYWDWEQHYENWETSI